MNNKVHRVYPRAPTDNALGPLGTAAPAQKDTETERLKESLDRALGTLSEPHFDHEGPRGDKEPGFGGYWSAEDDGQSSRGRCLLSGPSWSDFALFEPDDPRWSLEALSGSSTESVFVATGSSDEGAQAHDALGSSSMDTLQGYHGQDNFYGLGSWATRVSMPEKMASSEMMREIDTWSSAGHPRREVSPTMPRMPDLSPLPGSYEFCLCCSHDGEEVSNAWHMTTKDEESAQSK